MNKIVHCFWSDALREVWKNKNIKTNFKEFFHSSLNALYLSVLYAKKWSFKVEIVTSVNSSKHFKDLPIDKISLELEFLTYSQKSWIEGKMLTISRQTEPFIYIDWNIVLIEKNIVEIIKKCKEDFIVASHYNIIFNYNYKTGIEVNFRDLKI